LTYWLEGASARQVVSKSQELRSATPTFLDTSRSRLRFALFFCLALTGFLSFVIFPTKRISILADGSATVVISREGDVRALLSDAGLKQEVGDVVVQSGNELRVERALPVVVEVDGKALGWRTRAVNVAALLSELSIEVSPYDGVFVSGYQVGLEESFDPNGSGPAALAVSRALNPATAAGEGLILSIERAVAVTILEDGRPITVHSIQPTLGMALKDVGIQLGPADEISQSINAPLTAGLEVEIKHAKAVSVRVGGSTQLIYTHKESLRDALAEIGLQLGADDRVEPGLDSAVTNGMSARLVRVAGRQIFERENVQKKTVFKPDESLSGSASRVVQGHDGVRVQEFRVVIEDGVEVEKRLVKQSFEPEVVDTVIYYAAAAVRATGMPAENFNVTGTRHMYATWYNAASSGKAATDPAYGITASGRPVTRGIVAVDPSVIPLGTRLYVPGYGFAVAADTGGAIIGEMIDLGFPDGVASDWRTGYVDVYVLGPS
jgi:uncharacterized protein YabE (DUF348 family)/3D (Asp-Asp-Asp) domain-containing protein